MPTSDNSTTTLTIILLSGLILVSVSVSIAADSDLDARLRSDLNYLCSPELAGRNVPGTSGDRTALWVAGQFLDIGLHPLVGDSSYLQKVPLVEALLDTEITRLTLSSSNWIEDFWWGEDFYIFPKGIAPIDTILNASFCSYGIVSEDLGRDDFGKTAVNSAAIVLPHGPSKAGRQRLAPFKAAAAQRAGAKMLLIAYPIWNGKSWPPNDLGDKIEAARRYLTDLPDAIPSFPLIYLNGYMLTKHIAGGDPYQEWEDDPEFARAIAGVDVALKVGYRDRKETHGYNVIGKIDGTVNEYVVMGAHYDHLGVVEGDEGGAYYPGSDDNASGVAGLLEICRRWANRKMKGRGVIAVAFTAEEDGLLGSRWFVDHLPVSKESIIAMINLDGIGRRGFDNMRSVDQPDAKPDPRYAAAYYSAASPELKDILHGAGSGVDLELNIQPVNSFGHFGDAGPFHEVHIPTVNLFSGFHQDYHSPTDTPDKIDYEKMSLIIDLSDTLLNILTEESNRIGFDSSIKVETVIPH